MKTSSLPLEYIEDRFIAALRLSIALIFLWFGLLKVFELSPVAEIVGGTFPFLADGIGNTILGIGETTIGLLLFLNRWPSVIHTILVLHLCGTFLTLIMSPDLMFDPFFPILTLAGEFVIKNAILAMGGLVVLVHEHRRRIGPYRKAAQLP